MAVADELAFAAAGLLCVASCGRAARSEERVERFEAMLAEELGTEVELQCPPMVNRTHHYCSAVVPGHDDLVFPVRVVSRDDELDYSTKDWISGTRMEALGTHALEKKFHISVDSLECPMISHMPEGATVRCEGKAEGIDIALEARMVQKVRKLGFEPVEGIVSGAEAARVAQVTLHEQGVHADVTCSERFMASVPGKRFECEAVLPDETVRTIHYLITHTDGTFELGTEPPEADGSAGEDAPAEADAGPEAEDAEDMPT